MRLHAAHMANYIGQAEAVKGMGQVLVLHPRSKQRLVTLLHDRILPVALRSLRLWGKGEAICRQPVHMRHPALRCAMQAACISQQLLRNHCVGSACASDRHA